jgi:hypothetical protein
MRIVLAVPIALALLACGPGRTTHARHPGASVTFDRAASDPRALAIADRVLAAAGGATRWSEIKQVQWGQVVTNNGTEILAGEQAWDRWNGRHHARTRRADGDLVVMRPLYEDKGYAFIDNGVRLRRIDGGSVEALAAARERWEFDTAILFMPFLLHEPGARLEYAGETLGEDGQPHDVIKLTFAPQDRTRSATYHVVVDRDTHVISRIEIQKAGKADSERLGYRITRWLDAGGLKLPAAIENIGLEGERVTFENVSIAAPDESLYVPPL